MDVVGPLVFIGSWLLGKVVIEFNFGNLHPMLFLLILLMMDSLVVQIYCFGIEVAVHGANCVQVRIWARNTSFQL